ncbi:hypothetical protein Taro_022759, partial [Colocasia esculenta]|nr:hypothetical protein [Colocasia esculenta]
LTSWSVRGAGWFYLWALDLEEVRGGRAYSETLFSLGCLVSLGVTSGCSFPGLVELLPHVFDSAGSAGVVFGLTRVVVEAVVLLPLVGVPAALAGRDSLSQEFVSGWLWWRFVAPCIASSVSYERERF